MISKSQNNSYTSIYNNELENETSLVDGSQFEDTSEKNLHLKTYDKDDFKLVKSRLPFKDSVKMAASGLRQQPVRLVFVSIITLVAFTLMGFIITASTVSSRQILINNFNQYGFKNINITSVYNNGSYTSEYNASDISDEQLKAMENISGKRPLIPVGSGSSGIPTVNFNNYVTGTIDADMYDSMILDISYQYLRVPSNPALSNFTIKDDIDRTPAGRLPSEYAVDEVAINDWQASLFFKYGYRDINTGTIIDINKYSDLIGLPLGFGHIVGVVSTDVDIAMFDKYKDQEVGGLKSFVADGTKYTSLGYVYVGEMFDPNSSDIAQSLEWSFSDSSLSSHYAVSIDLTDSNNQHIKELTYGQSFPKLYNYSSVATANKVKGDGDRVLEGITVPQSMQADIDDMNLSLKDDEVFISLSMGYFDGYYYIDFNEDGLPIKIEDSLYEIFDKSGMKISLQTDNGAKIEYKVKGIIRAGTIDKPSPLEHFLNGQSIIFSNQEAERWRKDDTPTVESRRSVVLPLSDSKSIKDVLNFVDASGKSDGKGGTYSLQLNSNISGILSTVNGVLMKVTQALIYVGIGFAIFAGLLFMNFISTSVAFKLKQIGILRALGARSRDVFTIFFTEGILLAIILLTLSIISTWICLMIINNILTINVMSIGWQTLTTMIGVAMIVVFVATFIPVHKVANKNPVDAIKNR